MTKVTKPEVPMADLATLIKDASRVSNAEADILAHCYDCWPVAVKDRQAGESNHRPDVVVSVVSTAEVSAVLKFANDRGIAVTAWGLGSSVVGSPLAERGGITLDTSKMPQNIGRLVPKALFQHGISLFDALPIIADFDGFGHTTRLIQNFLDCREIKSAAHPCLGAF